MKGEILLIRHSLTQANEDKLYYGKTDLPLSPNGVALAKEMARAGIYKTKENCKYFTSGMKRANETLFLLFYKVPFTVDPDFREMDFGAFEMLSYEALKEREDYKLWISGDYEKNRCPDGESAEEMTARSIKAAERVLCLEAAAVVTHGGVISAIMSRYFPNEGKNRYEWLPQPCHGYCLHTEDAVPVSYSKL